MKAAHVILALAIAGLVDTGYLYFSYVNGSSLACSVLEGCNIVAQSPYSQLFGAPLSLWGLVFYACVFVTGLSLLTPWEAYAKKAFYVAAVIGIILSFCFSCIQAFLIGAWCIYCIISAAICVALFGIAARMWHTEQGERNIA